MNSSVPEDVAAFVARHIDSVAQLEALLLLRSNSSQAWDAARIAQRLYISEADARHVLDQLAASALATASDGMFRYEAATPELATAVDRLAYAYSQQLIPITNMIHSKPRRIRQFADAFKFRKDQ